MGNMLEIYVRTRTALLVVSILRSTYYKIASRSGDAREERVSVRIWITALAHDSRYIRRDIVTDIIKNF